MHRYLSRAPWALAVGLAAGCAGPSLSAAGSPAPPPAANTGALRAAAPPLAPCAVLRQDAQPECFQNALLAVLDSGGVAAAMAALERGAAVDSELKRNGHLYAHAIGLAAYTTPERVASTFERCTPSFQSGCYHGVIQSYFADYAAHHGRASLDSATVNSVCAPERRVESRWLLFQCAHGVGHGLTSLFDYDLPRVLRACDLVSDLWEREACYGGVFMENVMEATMPHHMVGRPGSADPMEHGPMAHMDHGAVASARTYLPLDPARPLYPCTVVDVRYRASCYQMQTSAILFQNHGDFAATAAACDAAPLDYRHVCYQSMGRDASAYTLQNDAEALRICSLGDPRFQPWCHLGYANNLVDLTARAEDGLRYCHLVPTEEGKRRCYEGMGQELWALGADEPARAAACATAEAAFEAVCRSGADLLPAEGRRPAA